MPSYVRPILVTLLCGLASIGHAPAWLHVADCVHVGHSRLTAAGKDTGCQHGCHHHHDDPSDRDESATPFDGSADGSHGDHDSDSCALCQSLAAPTGVRWQPECALLAETCVETARVARVSSPDSIALSIPQPRGPPAPIA